jgi:uridine kinase
MGAQPPHIVGIVGGSCAGKTWLADRLQQILGNEAVRVSQDDFYHDRSHLTPGRRARLNFDHPRAIDWKRLESVLLSFRAGRTASIPQYDFTTHGRLAGENLLTPARVIIVEGLWLFRRASLRACIDFKIFIRSTTELCAKRRLDRDVRERGRTREQVLDQLERYTIPMFNRFVAPQEKWADVLLEAPVTAADVQRVAGEIETKITDSVGI